MNKVVVGVDGPRSVRPQLSGAPRIWHEGPLWSRCARQARSGAMDGTDDVASAPPPECADATLGTRGPTATSARQTKGGLLR
jgi:hypothetical protein